MTVATVIQMPELLERISTWPARARRAEVVDPDTLAVASEELKVVKALEAEVDNTFDPIIKKQYEAHNETVAQKKRHRLPLEEAESIYKSGIGGYLAEQERKRLEEQRRLEEEARQREAEALEAEIVQAEAEGASQAEVEAIIERGPVPAPPVVLPPVAKPVAGVSTRELWAAEVTDLAALVKYVAVNPQFIGLLSPNLTAINGMARSLKNVMKIPGVRVYSTTSVGARRV